MPQWRKLHTKAIDSIDLAEMPDDFTRLTWVMLPLVLDRCGRGVDNANWVRSKVYPMRDDVTNDQIATALDWYEKRGMIERYSVDGRVYFWIPTWHIYQGNTAKEKESTIPAPDQYTGYIGSGYVYLMKCGRLYKIGVSVDPESRRRQIQTQLRKPLILIDYIYYLHPFDAEKWWHTELESKHKIYEWFALSNVDIARFCNVAEYQRNGM